MRVRLSRRGGGGQDNGGWKHGGDGKLKKDGTPNERGTRQGA